MSPAPPDGFRPGEDIADGELPVLEPAVLAFTSAADAGGTDFDVLVGYQLLLGRDPENSFVIADAKSSPVGAFIRALMGSGEFQSAVVDKLESGRPLPHEASTIGPVGRQVEWLLRHISVPGYAETMLRTAPTWRHFLRVLLAVPGVPRPPARAAVQAPDPGIAAIAADEGFVLIHLEQPKPGDAVHPGALVNGSGWTIAPADVTDVAVLLDGKVLAHARYGLPRPDVARHFPHYRHVDHCGFAFTAEIPADTVVTEHSQLVVRVRTGSGEEGNKAVRLLPPPATAPGSLGAGVEPWPIRLAVDDVEVDSRRVVRLRGWAATRAGLDSVRIFIGDAEIGRAAAGLARPDIARAYPDYADAAQAGFALVHGLAASFPAGQSSLRVQARDKRGLTRQTIVPVAIPQNPGDAPVLRAGVPQAAGVETAGAQPAVLEAPRAEGDRSGIFCACDVASLCTDGRVAISGWALAETGVDSIIVELDGLALGEVTRGLDRPDVGRRYPAIETADRSGFSLVHRLPRPPASGAHGLALHFGGAGGRKRVLELPLRAITPEVFPPEAAALFETGPAVAETRGATRASAADMRLELDRPVLEGDQARQTVRGALSIAGWAIARTGIAEVAVFCDDALLGVAHTGMRREDIGAAFPDYPGALLAGYALVLPPGMLREGRHLIRVVAKAKSGGKAKTGDTSPSPTTEIRFFIDVAPYDALPPGGEPREIMPPAEIALGLAVLDRAKCRPGFEVVIGLATADTAETDQLAVTLASLAAQAYPDWQVRLFPPASLSAASCKNLASLARSADPRGRIHVDAPQIQPPAQPRRGGAKQRRFLAKLRPGDVVGCDAWLECALETAADGAADLLYSDELRFDPAQDRQQPFFKPDWSPDLLLSMNFVGRLCCASAELVAAAGFSAETLAAASDYEAALRLSEQAARIAHVPRVLCRRGPAADSPAEEAAALQAAIARRKIRARVEPGAVPGSWRVRRDSARQRRAAAGSVPGLVSIIMPTCSARGLVRSAIETIRATTAPAVAGGPPVEILVLDNTPHADAQSRKWLREHADTVIDMPGPFNWSRFNNAGAAAARGEFLLFLNDDIEARAPGWLEALLEHALRPDVGVVGARLLYPDGKVQHAGQYLADGHARHAFRFAEGKSPGPFGLATVTREVISVTGACQMMHRRVFKRLGGFEEAHSVVNNDLDFCLRAWQAGLSVLYTPHATLIHHELASRAQLEDSFDAARFSGAWRMRFLAGDPFRNPHLGPEADHYGAEPEPAVQLFAGRRGPRASDVRRILALKLDHIGDFLTALPALRALRAHFPGAEIDLLAPGATASLATKGGLAANLSLAEIVVFDFFHARSGEGQKSMGQTELAALAERLAPKKYDLAIDLRMHPDTRHVLQSTGARCLAGYDHADRFPWLDIALEWEGDQRLVRKRAHVSERLVQLVSATADACRDPVQAPPAPRRAPAVLDAARVPALAALPARFRARKMVCIHPGVGNVVRQWPAPSYAALIDLLEAEAGMNVVLIGSAEEAPIAEDIMRRVAHPACVESLVGRVKLAELPAVMRACVLFVGNNSGPQHLAASLGMPSIGIHSGVVDAAEWAPLGAQAMAIRRRMVCSPCYLEFASDCPRDLACLTGLLPRDVFAACRGLLAGDTTCG